MLKDINILGRRTIGYRQYSRCNYLYEDPFTKILPNCKSCNYLQLLNCDNDRDINVHLCNYLNAVIGHSPELISKNCPRSIDQDDH